MFSVQSTEINELTAFNWFGEKNLSNYFDDKTAACLVIVFRKIQYFPILCKNKYLLHDNSNFIVLTIISFQGNRRMGGGVKKKEV